MKKPKGTVRFAYGKFENLPEDAEEIKLFMVPGEPIIYIVPISEMPESNQKIETEFDFDVTSLNW